MADIQNHLNKILTAIYGKDVRQSIHDAIRQCYADVSSPKLNTSAFYDAVQQAITDGTLATIVIADGSIEEIKLSDELKEKIENGTAIQSLSTRVSKLEEKVGDGIDDLGEMIGGGA